MAVIFLLIALGSWQIFQIFKYPASAVCERWSNMWWWSDCTVGLNYWCEILQKLQSFLCNLFSDGNKEHWCYGGTTVITPKHFLPHTPLPSALRCSIGRHRIAETPALHLLCHISFLCSIDFITRKKAGRLKRTALPFDPVTDCLTQSLFCSQNRSALCSSILDSGVAASEMEDLSVNFQSCRRPPVILVCR